MEQQTIIYLVGALLVLASYALYAWALWRLGTEGKPVWFGLIYLLHYTGAIALTSTIFGLSLIAGNVLGIVLAALLILLIALKGYASYQAAGETQSRSFILVLFVPFAWIFYLLKLGQR